jgi:hypothetical protein
MLEQNGHATKSEEDDVLTMMMVRTRRVALRLTEYGYMSVIRTRFVLKRMVMNCAIEERE